MMEQRIELTDAKDKLDHGQAIALDVTSSLVWPAVRNRLPHALRVAPEELLAHPDQAGAILERAGGVPRDRDLIVYCT
jgi:rhodanese-related sulfurtransferase